MLTIYCNSWAANYLGFVKKIQTQGERMTHKYCEYGKPRPGHAVGSTLRPPERATTRKGLVARLQHSGNKTVEQGTVPCQDGGRDSVCARSVVWMLALGCPRYLVTEGQQRRLC